MKVYLKLFLAAAIPYATALSLLLRNPAVGVALGIGFGILISGVFGTLQVRSMQGKKRASESYGVHQMREIEIDRPFHEAVELARAALEEMEGIKITRDSGVTMKEGSMVTTLDALAGLNWETYGEKVTLRMTQIDYDTTRIRIQSRPRLRTSLIDYGRNLHHVNAISQYLREHTASDHLRLTEIEEQGENVFYEEELAIKMEG